MEAVESVITDRKVKRARVTGLVGSAHAMFLAGLRKRKSPYLVIADDPEAAGYLYNDLCQIAGPENVAVFPSGYRRDIKYGQPDPPSQILPPGGLPTIRAGWWPRRRLSRRGYPVPMISETGRLTWPGGRSLP